MTADEIIRKLNLQPHPKEQGFFIESYRSLEKVSWEALPERYGSGRSFVTAIYFLLTRGGFSEMHRLKSDEIFHFYYGDAAELLILNPDGTGAQHRLGNRIDNGEMLQIVVPHGCWQGMRTLGEFTLFGCTVAPGFEYVDYESGKRQDLLTMFPAFSKIILQLTHS
jgi:predicted cupin superfamily sugar epimerase